MFPSEQSLEQERTWVFEDVKQVQKGQREVRGQSWGVVRDVGGGFRSPARWAEEKKSHVPFWILGSEAPTSLEEYFLRQTALRSSPFSFLLKAKAQSEEESWFSHFWTESRQSASRGCWLSGCHQPVLDGDPSARGFARWDHQLWQDQQSTSPIPV